MYKDKKVLVTGSSGFVGSKLSSLLIKQGANVIEFDKENGDDITDFESLTCFGEIDIIFHLAAIMFVPFTQKNPQITYSVNVLGTLNILELARISNSKLVFTSSYVYGNPEKLPVSEKHELKPTNTYSKSKILGEEMCKIFNQDYEVPVTILRPFNIYGKGQNDNFLIPLIVSQLNSGKIILNSKLPKRDFIHVSDVVSAYIKAGIYSANNFDIFNIGSGVSISVENLVDKIIYLSDKKPNVEYKNINRSNEIMDTVADIKKAKDLLDWKPKKSLDQGLSELLLI